MARAARAAEDLYEAGQRAVARSDVAAASNLLERALSLTPADGSLRPSIAGRLGEQPAQAGDFVRAEELFRVVERPSEALEEAGVKLDELLDQLTRAGDDHGGARATCCAFHCDMIASQAMLGGRIHLLGMTKQPWPRAISRTNSVPPRT